jgi:hypothetical protein
MTGELIGTPSAETEMTNGTTNTQMFLLELTMEIKEDDTKVPLNTSGNGVN